MEIADHEFRESTDSTINGTCIDLITGFELPHAGSSPNHDPSHIMTQNDRQAISQNAPELAVRDFRIEKVQPSGMDLNQDVILPQLG